MFEYHGICDLLLLHSSSYGNDLGETIHISTAERNGTEQAQPFDKMEI